MCMYFIDMSRHDDDFVFARAYFGPRSGIKGAKGCPGMLYCLCKLISHRLSKSAVQETNHI